MCFFSKRVSNFFNASESDNFFDYLSMSGEGVSLCPEHKRRTNLRPAFGFGRSPILLFDICSFAMPTPPLPNRLKPNVIIILTDDQGYADLGVYGSADLRTPNIDRMAQRGARIVHFYAQPSCGQQGGTPNGFLPDFSR